MLACLLDRLYLPQLRANKQHPPARRANVRPVNAQREPLMSTLHSVPHSLTETHRWVCPLYVPSPVNDWVRGTT